MIRFAKIGRIFQILCCFLVFCKSFSSLHKNVFAYFLYISTLILIIKYLGVQRTLKVPFFSTLSPIFSTFYPVFSTLIAVFLCLFSRYSRFLIPKIPFLWRKYSERCIRQPQNLFTYFIFTIHRLYIQSIMNICTKFFEYMFNVL